MAAALLVPLLAGVFRTALETPSSARVQMPVVETTPPPVPARDALPLLTESFPVDAPQTETEPWVEIVESSKIKIKERFYRINKGERFGFRRIDGDDVVFKTRNFLVSLPRSAVQIHYPESDESTAAAPPPVETKAEGPDGEDGKSALEITRAAQATAMERYPALSIKDSRENSAYVGAYLDLKRTNPDFFNDPEWPLQLAEAVAERDGWEREDVQQ